MESKAKRDRFPSGGPVGTLVLVGVIGLLSGLIPTGCSTTEPDPGVTPVDSLLFLPYDGESIAEIRSTDGVRYHLFGERDEDGVPTTLTRVIATSPQDSFLFSIEPGDDSVLMEGPLGDRVALALDDAGNVTGMDIYDALRGVTTSYDLADGKASAPAAPTVAIPRANRPEKLISPRPLRILCADGAILGEDQTGTPVLMFRVTYAGHERPITSFDLARWNGAYAHFEYRPPYDNPELFAPLCANAELWKEVMREYALNMVFPLGTLAAHAPTLEELLSVRVLQIWGGASLFFAIAKVINSLPCRIAHERFDAAGGVERLDMVIWATVNGRVQRWDVPDVSPVDDGTYLTVHLEEGAGFQDRIVARSVTRQHQLSLTTMSACGAAGDSFRIRMTPTAYAETGAHGQVGRRSAPRMGTAAFTSGNLLSCLDYEARFTRIRAGAPVGPPIDFEFDTNRTGPPFRFVHFRWRELSVGDAVMNGDWEFDEVLQQHRSGYVFGARNTVGEEYGWVEVLGLHNGPASGTVVCDDGLMLECSMGGIQIFAWPNCFGRVVSTVHGQLNWSIRVNATDLDSCELRLSFTPDDCDLGDDCTDGCSYVRSGEIVNAVISVEELNYWVGYARQ